MEKRLEIETPTSCLNKARDDEPVFVLRANDPLFGDVVGYWAFRAEQEGLHEPDKIEQARGIAAYGADWRLSRVVAVDDGGYVTEPARQTADEASAAPAAAPRDCLAHTDRIHRFTQRVEYRDDSRCACGAWQAEIVAAAKASS